MQSKRTHLRGSMASILHRVKELESFKKTSLDAKPRQLAGFGTYPVVQEGYQWHYLDEAGQLSEQSYPSEAQALFECGRYAATLNVDRK